MIDESAARGAIVAMLRAGVSDWSLLLGVARALSIAGIRRNDVVSFFWHIMNDASELAEEQALLVYDFTDALLGRCPLDKIVRLPGDPGDVHALSDVVGAAADLWRPPRSEDDTTRPSSCETQRRIHKIEDGRESEDDDG